MLKSLFPWKHHKTKAMAAQQTMDDVVPEDQSLNQPLLPCHVCGRTFLPTPLKKHERVCEKGATKRRKPFDSLRQRVEGTDLADFHRKTYLKKPEPSPILDPKKNKRQNNWKEKHLELVSTIRAAKGVPTEGTSHIKTKSTCMAGNERCPSCDRQFGPKAFDRHVEWCKEKKAQQRIHQSPADVLRAKERLDARIKYVPPLNRSKKIAVKDKYSNQNTSTSTETLASHKSTSPLSRGASVRKPKSEVHLGRDSDRASINEEREKSKVEKGAGGHGDKLKRQESLAERHTPVIASKTDMGKNSQKKKVTPYMKVNNTSLQQVDGICVASLKFDYTNKKMVTWRDTVENSSENDNKTDENNVPRKNCSKPKNPENSNSNSTQSVAMPEIDRENCEKIVSSSDILHKDATKIPLSKHAFHKKLNTNNRFKDTFANEEDIVDEGDVTSSQVKTANLTSTRETFAKAPKNIICPKTNDAKKINKKVVNKTTNNRTKCEQDSLEMNVKELEPITSISLKNKLDCPLPLTKKMFAKKINKSRKKFVTNEQDTDMPGITTNRSDSETGGDLLKMTINKKVITTSKFEKKSVIEETHHATQKGDATTIATADSVREKIILEAPTLLLKSSFTKKLNTDKIKKSIRKDEGIAKVDVDAIFNVTDNSNGQQEAGFKGKNRMNTCREAASELVETFHKDITITSRESEYSMVSNSSTINTEETYLVNQSSTDEFNSSQNFGNNNNFAYSNDSYTSLTLNYSSTDLTDKVDRQNVLEEKIGSGKFKNVSKIISESNDKRLDAVLDSSSSSLLTVDSSVLNVQNCSKSCNSVTEAFEKLTINSKVEIGQNTNDSQGNVEGKDTDIENDVQQLAEDEQPPLEVDGVIFDSFRNSHREFTSWFDEYMKKNDCDNEENLDDDVEYPPEEETADMESSQEVCAKPVEKVEINPKSDNLVLLFKSTTNLDLTGDMSSDRTDKKSSKLNDRISEETINTISCELDRFDLGYNKSSIYSLKKSLSDIDIMNTSSFSGLSNKNTLVSLYYNKNSDTESVVETRRGRTNSLPNIYFLDCTAICRNGDEMEKHRRNDSDDDGNREKIDRENGERSRFQREKGSTVGKDDKNIINRNDVLDERENLRRKILELAAEEFIEDCHEKETVNAEETVVVNDVCRLLEEDYTVPKKKRKVDSFMKTSKYSGTKVAHFSNVSFDLRKFKAMTLSDRGVFDENAMGDFVKKKSSSRPSSVSKDDSDGKSLVEGENNKRPEESVRSDTSSRPNTVSTECSPRLVTILDKVLNNSDSTDNSENKALIVITLSDCMKLVDLDKKKLPKIKRHLEKIKNTHRNKCEDVNLPPIGIGGRKDKEIQASAGEEGNRHLPKIMDKFIRRGILKMCTMDVKTGVKDVYLEYDSESINFTYDPFESAQRQFMELLDCDDFKSLAPISTPVKHTPPRPHTTNSITPAKQQSPAIKKNTVKSAEPVLTKVNKTGNRASVIDPPNIFKDSLDSITDDFELMENLIRDQFSDDNNKNNSFYLHLKPEKESLTLSDILDNRKYSDDMSCIDPRLINENDNLSIPEHFKIDDFSPTSTADTDITLQNDVDHYSLQYDNKIAVFEPKPDKKTSAAEKKPVVKRSNSLVNRSKADDGSLKVTSKRLTSKSNLTSRSISSVATSKVASSEKKKGLPTLKKSTPLFETVPRPPSLKNKNDVDNYFLEKQQKNLDADRTSPEKELCDTLEDALKPGDLFAVDDEMYEEYKKYEEMYLKEKAQTSPKKKHKPKLIDINFGILTASEEEEQSTNNNKISNDSAYGSLTRKTPKHRSRATKLTPLEQKQADSTSSSGSERCPNSPAVVQRAPKFCHECGNKYPLTTAKFCVECGVKRLVL